MKIIWQVEDGYSGGSRPQYCTIPDDELEGLTEQEQDDYIEEYIQHEFENKISFSWKRRN